MIKIWFRVVFVHQEFKNKIIKYVNKKMQREIQRKSINSVQFREICSKHISFEVSVYFIFEDISRL